jgi:hypothetical protein
MLQMMKQPLYDRSTEYSDNRISLFSAQWGKCAVTGKDFQTLNDIHCHHKTPRKFDGGDVYQNLILVLEPIHKLIHATQKETIDKYMQIFDLSKEQNQKLNKLRKQAKLPELTE